MTFGDYLKAARLDAGLTAQDLGKVIGTTGQYITQTETGKLKAPNKKMTEIMAEALNLSPGEIWGIAALERFAYWCRKEGVDPENAQTFFQAARYDKKNAAQRKGF